MSDPRESRPTISPDVAEGARKTADYIRAHGWCQNQYRNAAGECCLMGAINRSGALGNGLVEEIQGRTREPIELWNDRPGRSVDEVLALLSTISTGGSK